MNQRLIGIIVIIIGVLLASFVYMAKLQEDKAINQMIKEQGSCYLPDGTCLHEDRSYTIYIFGGVLSLGLIILGIYLVAFDRTQSILAEQNRQVAGALAEAKKKDEFTAYLSGFNEDEQKLIKAVREQEGIKQSTLRYRIGMSKTSLSLMLKDLEHRGIISRKESGKTNEIFLRKRF